MRRARHHLFSIVLFSLLVVAFATGLGGRSVPSDMDLRMDAWLMAGASMGDLCGDHDGGDDRGGHCPLCTLTQPAGLPPVITPIMDAEQRILARIVLPQMRRAAGHARDPAVPQRGPPNLI